MILKLLAPWCHDCSDEFHDYGTSNVLTYLEKADAAGVNEIKGTYVDRSKRGSWGGGCLRNLVLDSQTMFA